MKATAANKNWFVSRLLKSAAPMAIKTPIAKITNPAKATNPPKAVFNRFSVVRADNSYQFRLAY